PIVAVSDASSATSSSFELTNVVCLNALLICTVDVGVKFAPITTTVCGPEPEAIVDGVTELMVGPPVETMSQRNGSDCESAEFCTITANVPLSCRSVASSDADSEPSVLKFVGFSAPLKMIFDVVRNPLPITVIVAPVPPNGSAAGVTEMIEGRSTLRRIGAEVAPLSVTVIDNDPGAEISAAAMCVVSAPVPFASAAARGVPLRWMPDGEEKFEPLTASWKPTS